MDLRDIKDSIRNNFDEKDYWTSYAVKSYFTDISKAVLDRYGTDFQINVKVVYELDGNIAYTTFDSIVLNAACKQVRKINRRENKLLYLKGLLAHELSHILYMDKKLDKRYFDGLLNGVIIPRIPKSDGKEKKLLDALKDKGKAAVLSGILKYLLNSIEDGYGENTYLANYYGSLTDGMKYMRREFYKDLSATEDLEKDLASDDPEKRYSAVQGIVLTYSLYYRLKGNGKYPLCETVVEKISDTIKKTLSCDFKERLNCLNLLLIELWDYIEPLLEKEKDNKDNKAPSAAGSGTPGNGGTGGGCGGEPQRNKPDHGNDLGNTRPLSGQNEQAKPEQFNEKDDSDIQAGNTEKDLFEQVIDELARREKERQNLNSMNQQANEGKCCGCPVVVYRDIVVDSDAMNQYEAFSEVLSVSKKIQRTLKQQLEDKRRGGKKSGLYLGRKVEVRNVIRNDGRCFYSNDLPKNTPRICVSLVIDESGSMCAGDSCNVPRIVHAKRVAVIIEDFCRALGFAVMIIGSTADYMEEQKSELTVYSSFDSADDNDRYRIMGINAKGCNRDGAAFAFALKQLMARQEEIKILFIMSDGKPNARGYGGPSAIEELKQLNEKAKKSNVVVFSAAIGEDKKQIEAIYGDSFLDITDLDAMPRMFIDRIKTFIR